MRPAAAPHRRSACFWAFLLLLGMAGRPATPAAAEDSPGEGIAWVRSLEEGLSHARENGTLVFLVYTRERPPCAPCQQLEREVFAKPDSAMLGQRYVAVRILGGKDATGASRALAKRYGMTGTPTLLAIAPDGGLITRNIPRTLDGIVETLAQATKDEAAFQKRVASLRDADAPEDVRVLAGLYAARRDWPRARRHYDQLITLGKATADDEAALANVLAGLGDADAEADVLRRLIERHPNHAARTAWRVRLVAVEARGSVTDEHDRLLALLGETEDVAAGAVIRLRLAALLHAQRKTPEAVMHWDWILARAPKSPEAVEALFRKASATVTRGYGLANLGMLREGRKLLKRLTKGHPEHAHADEARRMLVRLDQVIDDLEAKVRRDAKN